MDFLRTALRGRMGMVAAAAVLLMMVGMLSVSGDTAYAVTTTEGPTGANCTNALDDNGNGWVNEGCNQVGATAETGLQCAGATNDDPGDDAVVNDGCPAQTGANYNNSASLVKFRIPGTPATRTTADLTGGTGSPVQCSVGTPCTLTVDNTAAFPATCAPTTTCQILVVDGLWGDGDKDGAEILTYNSKTGTSFNIIERGPDKISGTSKKAHIIGSLVKMATVLTTAVTGSDGPQTRMTDADTVAASLQDMTAIRGGCTLVAGETFATCPAGNLPSPFAIQLTSSTGFTGTAGNEYITINHQDLQASNQGGVGPGQSGEMMKYDLSNPCGGVALGANQICIIQRAQQSTNRAYPHKRDGYPQPSQVSNVAGPLGTTKVSLHFPLDVKSNAGFFPAGSLLVCNAGNPLTNCELMGHNNSATKIKTPADTEFHVTDRCADASTLNKAPNAGSGSTTTSTVCTFPPHAANTSIVTGADNFILCRVGASQPGVDGDLSIAGFQEPATQVPGTSVGQAAVCYTQSQPKDGPVKPPWPFIVGQDLLALNAIAGQSFLGTGGYCHVALGPVGTGPSSCPGTPPLPFDANGPNDGILVVGSPCIPDFTPGTNLQVTASINVDKTVIGIATGTVSVVTDTVHDNIEGNADDCDDPAAGDTFEFDTYDSSIAEPGIEKFDDTDRDGCVDEKELRSALNQGGLRDPWNPYDWYDINHDGAVSIPVDVLQVAQANGVGNPNYLARKDRGVLNYGPFGWNKSAPNGGIDITSDVLGVAQQFSAPCLHDSDTLTATHETYNTGVAWPAGNGPWYIQIAGNGVPNH